MKTETIKDWRGVIIGFIDYKDNGDKEARKFNGGIVGKYNASLDITTDWRGHMVSKGDTLISFLYE